MEKFTKQEIETAKKVFESYQINQRNQPSYTYYLDSLLKPETKKIVVEIETGKIFSVSDIKHALNYRFSEKEYNFKVTELPEVFSREQVIDIFDPSFTSKDYIDGLITKWLSERSKK